MFQLNGLLALRRLFYFKGNKITLAQPEISKILYARSVNEDNPMIFCLYEAVTFFFIV